MPARATTTGRVPAKLRVRPAGGVEAQGGALRASATAPAPMTQPAKAAGGKGDRLCGVIDVGSSGIRMEIARVSPAGQLTVVEVLSRSVPLGVDAFRNGHLSRESIDAAVDTLRGFHKVLSLHKVDRLRAVATSALREVDNADTLLDRVLQATGIEVQVIDGAEENRLNFLAVERALRGVVDLASGDAAIIEVGGGSVDLTLLQKGRPVSSESQPMGSVRMLESGRRLGLSHARLVAGLRRQIRSAVGKFERNLPMSRVKLFVALGSEMRFAADHAGDLLSPQSRRIEKDAFRALCKELALQDPEALVRRTRLTYAECERLVPTLLTYEELLAQTAATSLVVPRCSLRDGLLLELGAPGIAGSVATLRPQVVSSATALGKKFAFDEGHGTVVASLSLQLFDALAPDHGLGEEERLCLEVAALLHDIGLFIGSRAHHKHGFYIVSSSELFGMNRRQLDIVAHVVRYHRRATPQKGHPSYMALTRKQRMVVNKLASILRLADALDREHEGRFRDVKVVRGEGPTEIWLPVAPVEMESEMSAFEVKKGLFVEVFGKDIVLRGAGVD